MTRKPLLLLIFLIASAALLAGCADEPTPVAGGTLEGINVRVAQAPGAENQALAALYAEAFAAAGASVETQPVATEDAGLQATTDGTADVYLDFAGRLYTDVLDLPVKEGAPPPRIEVAKAVSDKLEERGVTTLNRAAYNAVPRAVCTPEILRRAGAVNLSGLAASTEKTRWTSTPAQNGDDGLVATINTYYPGLVDEPVESGDGAQFAKLRDDDADCALGPAGAPQISRFGFVPVADDLGKVLPNQAIILTNTDFVLAAPDRFSEIANRVTAILDDEKVREINAAVQLDERDVARTARETLDEAGVTVPE